MIDKEGYRYPGPNEFEDNPTDQALFCGRTDEIYAITRQVISSQLLVLYGNSGLGKSSLLKAGIFPKLRECGFSPIRVRITDQIPVLQLLADSCEEVSREFHLDYTSGIGATAWEFFKTVMFWRCETLLYPVLVFDQFEEIFTRVSPDWRREFASQIGPLASGFLPDTVRRRLEQGEQGLTDVPPRIKLIFSIREEFYGSLQALSSDFPTLFQNRFRLLALDRKQAQLAITDPALKNSNGITFVTPPFLYEADTLNAMLDFLAGSHETIEPFQLQLLCQHIERVVVPSKRRDGSASPVNVTPEDIGDQQAMSDLIRRFYTDSLNQLPALQQRRARELCDTGLLSADGHRLMLQKNEILRNYRISENTLKHLINTRILREEPRLDSLFYEIGHDTIAQSILGTRRWRFPRKYRVPAALVAIVILVSLLIIINANVRLRDERNVEAQAKQGAVQARDSAELLASYLIGEELMDAIRPLGRLEVMESVGRQVDGYLKSVEANQQARPSSLAIKIEGLAHLNRGDLYSQKLQLTEAKKEYQQALSAFRELLLRDSKNAEWRHDLAEAEGKLGTLAQDRLHLQEALDLHTRALVDIQKSLAEQQFAMDDKLGDKILRDEAETLQSIGDILRLQGNLKEALKHIEQSVKIANEQRNPTTQWLYILQYGRLGQGIVLTEQGQRSQAERALTEALETAKQTARMNPYEPEAQRRIAFSQNRLANLHVYGNTERALAEYKRLHQIIEEETRWEPRNQRWQRDLAETLSLLGDAYSSAGQTDAAEDSYKQALSKFRELRNIDASNASLAQDSADAHVDWAEMLLEKYESDKALQHFDEAIRIYAQLRTIDSTNADLTARSVYLLASKIRAHSVTGDPGKAAGAYKDAVNLVHSLGTPDPTDGNYWLRLSYLHSEMARAVARQGDVWDAENKYQQSLKDIEEATRRVPSSAECWNARYLLLDAWARIKTEPEQELERKRLALAAAKKAAELDPGTVIFHENLARVQRDLGNLFEARGELALALSSYENAEHAFQSAMQLTNQQKENDYRASLYSLLVDDIAPLRGKLNDKAGMLKAYQEAMKLKENEAAAEPNSAVSHSTVAGAYEHVGDELRRTGYSAEAQELYRKAAALQRDAISLDPRKGDYYFGLAKLSEKQGDKAGMLNAYRDAMQLKESDVASEPNSADSHAALAKAYEDAGDQLSSTGYSAEAQGFYEKAAASRRNAIDRDPKNAARWDALGKVFSFDLAPISKKQGDDISALQFYRSAVQAAEQATALEPKNADYQFKLALARESVGDLLRETGGDQAAAKHEYDEAIYAIDRAAQLNPTILTRDKKRTQNYNKRRSEIEKKIQQLSNQ